MQLIGNLLHKVSFCYILPELILVFEELTSVYKYTLTNVILGSAPLSPWTVSSLSTGTIPCPASSNSALATVSGTEWGAGELSGWMRAFPLECGVVTTQHTCWASKVRQGPECSAHVNSVSVRD